ncbi:acyl-CoA thioester hydrolase [Halopolyspora algeriensis]|uniref:Acyl-CoA thioester hydrolase n=1 Tax=Halopolyspora algeriensis TaxID=1500506 RepID=A0A368VTN9_9ACTN|nr:thioesterase family protein [Halopolyspora algeriensis]RCW45115.1 acyl-CoA thioester hydrolase [Halopolyspora algeriensis]TQM53163.1 acyl-CoA thioester hydrolase [Halopolyspora algeriensis]
MGAFIAEVALRWSDMDAFGHVNHARTVTLLEEARAGLLFTEAERQGLSGMAEGMVVARVVIDYHAPLVYRAGAIQVRMSVRDLRAASFVIDYTATAGDAASVATAETLMVPYDLAAGRPRRLTDGEREFLAEWQLDPALTNKERDLA